MFPKQIMLNIILLFMLMINGCKTESHIEKITGLWQFSHPKSSPQLKNEKIERPVLHFTNGKVFCNGVLIGSYYSNQGNLILKEKSFTPTTITPVSLKEKNKTIEYIIIDSTPESFFRGEKLYYRKVK